MTHQLGLRGATVMLQDIIRYLETAESESSAIADSEVRGWMSGDDPEVLGATYAFFTNAELVQRITPSMSFDDVFEFVIRSYEFCLRNDPQGDLVDDRFSTACNFVSAFVSMWDEGRDRKYFREMKSLSSHLYTEGPGDLKDSIELAIVEHLFEREDIREFFSDWRDDPQLQPAYEAGKLWAEGGGTSPLTQSRSKQP
jgi:hypothetical protein